MSSEVSEWHKEMKTDFGGMKTWVQILTLAFSSSLSVSELYYLTEQSANSSAK